MGFSVANTSLWAIPIALAFFWFYYPPAIEYEDRKLHSIFGDTWKDWASRTPALLPKLTNTGNVGAGQWSFATSMKKNGELVIAIFVLACAYRVVAPLI
jgi:hypothetical protein